eukprot:gene52698-70445_t
MTRMGRFFDDHDELYWNATGNYWNFPILKATATLVLPKGAEISGSVGYTGAVGSMEQAVTIVSRPPNGAIFTATRTLAPGEGMSVAVKFQKGILVQPTGSAAAGNWLSDHRTLVFPILAVLLVLGYNLWAWNAVGRDPQKGTIIPLFHPPADLTPALVHYIKQMGFKQNGWTAFTASIFDLGVKGLVTIDKSGGTTPNQALASLAGTTRISTATSIGPGCQKSSKGSGVWPSCFSMARLLIGKSPLWVVNSLCCSQRRLKSGRMI